MQNIVQKIVDIFFNIYYTAFMRSKNTKEKIEFTADEFEALAELVFLGELVINRERNTAISHYAEVKEKVLDAYRKEPTSDVPSGKDRENHFYSERVDEYLKAYDAAMLMYILSDKLAKVIEFSSDRKNALEDIKDWRRESLALLEKISP